MKINMMDLRKSLEEPEYCNNECEYFKLPDVNNTDHYRCLSPLVIDKNGNHKILNHGNLLRHKLPEWCPRRKEEANLND